MDLKSLKQSLHAKEPPSGLDEPLQALWHQGKGDWHKAHEHAQKAADEAGAWVHAHLHRVEGDERNAAHWYRRAGRQPSSLALEAEWDEIAAALLGRR